MHITDAQIHLWTGDQAPPHHWRAPYTIEAALRDMDIAGISRAVNCPAIWDATANDYAVQAALSHPKRFATMGWFPLDDRANEAMVDDWLAKPGMLGLRFLLVTPEIAAQIANGSLDWLWSAADSRQLPVALMVAPQLLPAIGLIAARFPRMRLLLDHLSVSPFEKLPQAAAHLDTLLALARQPNIAVKASGVPSMAIDAYPYVSTHKVLQQTFKAFGAERMFWGTDITRLSCNWRDCVTSFTEELPWLKGRELELVMGDAISNWLNWPRS